MPGKMQTTNIFIVRGYGLIEFGFFSLAYIKAQNQ